VSMSAQQRQHGLQIGLDSADDGPMYEDSHQAVARPPQPVCPGRTHSPKPHRSLVTTAGSAQDSTSTRISRQAPPHHRGPRKSLEHP
jgi:hypothetical protein